MDSNKSRFAGLDVAPVPRTRSSTGAVVRDADYYLAAALERELGGDHEKALNHYSAALGEDPLCIEAWARQLWMLLYLEEPGEAAVWADKALQSFPKDPDILSLKGLAEWRAGHAEAARELNDAALAASRDSAAVWLSRGEMQIGSDMKSAIACFKHAEASPGPKGLVLLRAADILLRRRRYAEAANYYRTATRELPQSSWVWYGYGRAQRALGDEAYARIAFERAWRLSPSDKRYRDACKKKGGWWRRMWSWMASFGK